MKSFRRVVLTTGDLDGIGLEVTAKALEKIGPQKGVLFLYFRGTKAPVPLLKRIGRRFRIHSFNSWPEALAFEPRSTKDIVEITSAQPPPKWVETAAVACLHSKVDALVTGPLSKPEIKRAGLTDLGHTDILKRVSSTKDAWMTFLGDQFNVFLLSGHLPVKEVEASLSAEKVEKGLREAVRFFSSLEKKPLKKPLAVLGLNPHAGDSSLIGRFDDEVLAPVLSRLQKEGLPLVGPLVPDVSFLKTNWKKYSAYIACYHDQGLIPFKMTHGFESGVHVTAGLPFVRTSVDHGTAKDLFGKNRADARSMREAIRTALRLTQPRTAR
jgi:4-hydroxythreonine-4-phosphate dehydrogenase